MRILPIALLAAAALVAAPAAHANVKPPTVPSTLQPPAGNKPFKSMHAVGVQIYQCNGTAWTFVAPRADLYNRHGKVRIKHFAGPTWQHKDGSSVVGAVFAPPVSVTPTAIPWLLLKAASTTPGAFGDKLTKTTFIQRIETTGGLAPAASTCTTAASGTRAEVPYTAEYVFWTSKH